MKTWIVAALAAALVASPLAAQSTSAGSGSSRNRIALKQHGDATSPMASGKRQWGHLLVTQYDDALTLVGRLQKREGSAQMKVDVDALGKALAASSADLDELERGATTQQKTVLARVRTHDQAAHTHYDELVKAMPSDALVAKHAAAVHQHLAAARAALGGGKGPFRDSWQAH